MTKNQKQNKRSKLTKQDRNSTYMLLALMITLPISIIMLILVTILIIMGL